MQTFLPYKDFRDCASVLDYRRLGNQRVEAKTILSILSGKSTGWPNHPAVLMWKGYERELGYYYNCIVEEWIDRGYVNNLKLRKNVKYSIPDWINLKLIRSHRSNLLRKDFEFYSQYKWKVSDNLEYYWPVTKDM